MTKKVNSVASLVASETTKGVSNKVSVKADLVENTSYSIDEEESESIKKGEVFASVRELFGFATVRTTDEIADELQDLHPDWKFSKIRKESVKIAKTVKTENEKHEGLTFEQVCTKIQESDLIEDFSLYVGTKDLLSLSSFLLNNNKVVLFHGKQSEDSEKFETFKVTKKGLHKPYTDLTYISHVELNTSNIIRSFRCFGYYLASEKRVNRMIENENRKSTAFGEVANTLHKDLGFMPKDLISICAKSYGLSVDEFISKCK